MFKKVYLPLLGMLVLFSCLLTGCGCKHEWKDATCDAPKTCIKCGETEGEALNHKWTDATCDAPKTCIKCNETEGEAFHKWKDATCEAPKTCSACKKTEGNALGHKWTDATTEAPKTCSVCQKTEGDPIQTDMRFKTERCQCVFGTWSGNINIPSSYFNLPALSGGLDFKITLTFHNDGNYEATAILANKDTVVGHLWAYYVNAFYAEFAKQNLNETQADAAMVATYGMDVKAYSKKLAEATDFDKLLASLEEDGVYYVSNSNGEMVMGNTGRYLCFSYDWINDAGMHKCSFQIINGTQLFISQYPFTVPGFPYRYPILIILTKN